MKIYKNSFLCNKNISANEIFWPNYRLSLSTGVFLHSNDVFFVPRRNLKSWKKRNFLYLFCQVRTLQIQIKWAIGCLLIFAKIFLIICHFLIILEASLSLNSQTRIFVRKKLNWEVFLNLKFSDFWTYDYALLLK